ncbi:uncharacterized protein LOC106143224 [Amyelois transitella]|uniref:uncharacterized protein LOC106143224 n=1 Tax=Amyelois transitella TaxID=680683 RepID=UPI0029902793|nr:uncharacterized protein LOC106143224 [Amyelois transitella]
MRACFTVACLLLAVFSACSAFGIPTTGESLPIQTGVALRQQQLDIIGNTRRLIEQLVENLQKAAREAIDAVSNFRDGVVEQAKLIREKIVAEIQKLRDRVEGALQTVYDKFANSGQQVRECIDKQRQQAQVVFNETLKDSLACADDRIKEIGEQLDSLTTLANNASDFASSAMEEMRDCIDKNQPNMLAVGSCLGSVALRIEMRGAVFVTQSGLQIGRLNLALGTLPAALEVCAGTRLVQAGVATARLVMEIGTCSASSIFSSFVDTTALCLDFVRCKILYSPQKHSISQTKNLINGNNHIKIIQSYDDNTLDRNQELSQILEIYDQRHLRSISDLWQSIKNTAVSTWNHIKNIAIKTKDKIQAIIGQMKDKIAQIQANFEERLKELQNQVNDLIDKAITTGQNIKECIQKEKEAIDKIAKEILRNVTTCVSENILQLSHLEGTLKIYIDEKDFQNKLDIRLDECVLKEDIDEECLHGVREELFCEVEKIEIDVLQRGEQSRNLAEDILQAIISCTTEGLIAASSNITMEAITVVKCAAEESETGTEAIPI